MDNNSFQNQKSNHNLDDFGYEDSQIKEYNESEKSNNIKKREYSNMATASLVLGIISVVSFLFWYISLPSAILSIIFGVKSSKYGGSKQGKAGMVLGIIGGSLLIAAYVLVIIYLVGMNAFA